MDRPPEARRDLLSAAGLAALAILYLLASRRYSLDTLATPGPGLFPRVVGFCALLLAIGQAVVATTRSADAVPDGVSGNAAAGRVVAMLALLVAYTAALSALGFLTSSAVLVVVSSRLLGARGWLRPVALALGVTAALHVIFVLWLGVPLPRGLLR